MLTLSETVLFQPRHKSISNAVWMRVFIFGLNVKIWLIADNLSLFILFFMKQYNDKALRHAYVRELKRKIVNKGKPSVIGCDLKSIGGLHFSHARRKMVTDW